MVLIMFVPLLFHLDDLRDQVFVEISEEKLLSGSTSVGREKRLVAGQNLPVLKLVTQKQNRTQPQHHRPFGIPLPHSLRYLLTAPKRA